MSETAVKWPTITMWGCAHCGRVSAVPRAKVESYQHWCEPRKDFIFGDLTPIQYEPKGAEAA